ncbi:Peptidase inhibitor family I36 [Amycolatopsis xylanica]|uniref:Peptidase inhibitor family I36 n=1 Tax=Amycolatopsis xylanica TaxID=589385 RepID=A0A1H2W8X3_9PSEU|nr:peptidase inhibitor family I36 protein [Amycolatopsis xylanica]SDW76499.1 Peptidase inhibitor family I36 [Amycolatopsis xylanica]
MAEVAPAILCLSLANSAVAAPMSHAQCDPVTDAYCGWTGTGYGGGFYLWQKSTSNTGVPIRSMWNKRGSWVVVVYSGTNYTGSRYTVNAGASVLALPFDVWSAASSG